VGFNSAQQYTDNIHLVINKHEAPAQSCLGRGQRYQTCTMTWAMRAHLRRDQPYVLRRPLQPCGFLDRQRVDALPCEERQEFCQLMPCPCAKPPQLGSQNTTCVGLFSVLRAMLPHAGQSTKSRHPVQRNLVRCTQSKVSS